MKKLILFILPILLLASVGVSVNKKELTKGEELVITLTATGNNIKFPQISSIAGYNVIGTSVVSNIEVINGAMKESLSKSYIIIPDKNLTIPSFSIEVDGKTYKTKPIHITVKTPEATKGDYTLELNISKKNLYLGQSAILTATLHFKPPVESIQIQKPQIDGFVVQEISKQAFNNKAVYKFLITPLKAGNFTMGPLIAHVGILVKENPFNDPFFNLSVSSLKYKTVYSNQIRLKVKPIAQNSVYGNFRITLNASKQVNANEPNKAVLKITGCGDFNDLPEFKLNIPNTTVYESKPDINLTIKNNRICGTYTKTFTILSDHDYTIPSLTLNEFNSTLHRLSTKPVKVTVTGSVTKTSAVSKQPQQAPIHTKTEKEKKKEQKKDYLQYLIYLGILLAGVAIGVGVMMFTKNKNTKSIYTKIKKAGEKELFNILIPYSDNPEIKAVLTKLEENIYKNANHKINKKEIIKTIKKITSD